MSVVAIRPERGESEEDFIVRAHTALAQSIPDPGDRNKTIWQAWDSSMGNPLLAQAHNYFSAEQYSPTEPRPFFLEHEKVNFGADGAEQITNYDLGELTKIVRENNHRIQDTDAYTALVDKHTLPPPYRDPDPPKNLGFVGPFRLGMLGRSNPRWAIFANEWQRADKAEQLRDRPNRSVEVLQLKANGRRYIDPIAALSEAPRLPLPTTAQYSAEGSDQEAITVERYDATPAISSYPGGFNPGTKKFKRENYQGKSMNGSPVDPDMVRELLNALMSTEEWQTISEAAQTLGKNQPVNSGQDVMQDAPMEDPMAGGMPEPPMEQPGEMPMEEPAGMPGEIPQMAPEGMEEEYIQEDVEDAPGADRNIAPALAAMGASAAMSAGKGIANAMKGGDQNGAKYMGNHYGKTASVDRNNPAVLATAGRAAAGGAGRAAARGGTGRLAKDMAIDAGVGKLQQKMSKGAAPQKKGILARILEGATEENQKSSPQQFGAVKGYHRYSGLEGNMRRDQYAALSAENEAMKSELSQLKAHNNSLLTEQAEMYAATQHEVVQLRQSAIDAERKERLNHLANQYAAVDLKKEMEECLYANGSEMDNEAFDQRVELIQHYCAASAPSSPLIPLGYDGRLSQGDVQSDKFAAQVADRALDLVNEAVKSGNRVNYQEAVEKAKAELSAE